MSFICLNLILLTPTSPALWSSLFWPNPCPCVCLALLYTLHIHALTVISIPWLLLSSQSVRTPFLPSFSSSTAQDSSHNSPSQDLGWDTEHLSPSLSYLLLSVLMRSTLHFLCPLSFQLSKQVLQVFSCPCKFSASTATLSSHRKTEAIRLKLWPSAGCRTLVDLSATYFWSVPKSVLSSQACSFHWYLRSWIQPLDEHFLLIVAHLP